MQSFEEFFKHPGWGEICRQIKFEISQAQRPASEIILDDVELCEKLKISKRTSADMRDKKEIKFSKPRGKVLYILSDVLEYVNSHKAETNEPLKSRFK
jgi:hypothetical protein